MTVVYYKGNRSKFQSLQNNANWEQDMTELSSNSGSFVVETHDITKDLNNFNNYKAEYSMLRALDFN